MAATKWQCTKCGATQTAERPTTGGFCGQSSDHKHKWSKITMRPTKWQCKECGSSQTTNGLRPPVGSFCGKSKDHKHRWVKV